MVVLQTGSFFVGSILSDILLGVGIISFILLMFILVAIVLVIKAAIAVSPAVGAILIGLIGFIVGWFEESNDKSQTTENKPNIGSENTGGLQSNNTTRIFSSNQSSETDVDDKTQTTSSLDDEFDECGQIKE